MTGLASVTTAADEQRRRGLRRMRAIALSLLLLAAVVYLLTRGGVGVWGFVNAGAEAAMVGALADWFAVTAIFRHPLGLPVPHTAIIPSRKEALGKSLEDFVVGNFLTVEAARERVAAADVAGRAGTWVADPVHAQRVVAEVSKQVSLGLGALDDEQVQGFVTDALLPRLTTEPLSAIAGSLLGSVVQDRAHHGLVDLVFVEAYSWLEANQDVVSVIVRERAPWWSPSWLDDKVVDRIQVEALAWVRDVRDNPGHPARRALDSYLARLAVNLQSDPPTMERFEALKTRLLTHPELGGSVLAIWQAVRTALRSALDEPTSALRVRLAAELAAFGTRLVSDDDLRARVDGYVADAAAFVVRTYGREIATVISQTVDRWDGEEAAQRIELHVGRDLQFIRINGTIVGALVGLVIHTVDLLL